MSQTDHLLRATSAVPATDPLLNTLLTSRAVARSVVVGMPMLGLIAAASVASTGLAMLLMAGFIAATAIVCTKALVTFTGRTLRLLLAARFAIVVTVVSLLFATAGVPHNCLVNGILAWLVADRLMGGRALLDLWRLVAKRG